MDQNKINVFLVTNKDKFTLQQWTVVKDELNKLPDEKAVQVIVTQYRSPSTMQVIAICLGFLGIDRYMLGDIGLGILKFLSMACGGIIWVIVDIFSVKRRTYDYNFKKFNESLVY